MRRKLAGIPVLLLAIATLSGCQAFFTTSLATGLARDSITVPANISNEDAAALLNETDDPVILASLLEVLNTQAAAGDAAAGTLAAEAAINVSGVSETIMSTFSDVIATSTLPTDLSTFVDSLKAGYDEAGVSTALLALDDPAVAEGLEPTQLLVAAVLLATSQLETATYTIDVNNPDADPAALSAYQANPTVALALTLANQAATDISTSGGDPALAEMMAGLLPMETTP